MESFFATLLFMGTIMLVMAVGVIFRNKPLKGSCGGVGAALGEKNYECDICGGDPKKCDEQQLQQPKEQLQQLAETLDDLSYDATKHKASNKK